MASKKKQKGMVFHQEGAVAPAAASSPDIPPVCFVPRQTKESKGGMEQSSHAVNDEADIIGEHNTYPSKAAARTSSELPAVKHSTSSNSQSDNLPPDSICKGIRVILDNNSMWNEFFKCKTEMILTKQGSRMFPYCRFRISGMNPSRKYSLIMDILPLDNSHYKWTGKSWQVAGKAECHVKSQPFAHPESPSMGQHWMQNPVSFYKLKLTNNISDQDGNTVLHPMHRYLPRLHVVQTDKAAKELNLNDPSVVTFTFPQTEFMAVIGYQNSRFTQLKVDYNPFAKGLKEDGSSSWGLKLKVNSGKESHKDGGIREIEQHPVKKSLKSLLANHKPRSSKAVDTTPSLLGDLQTNSSTSKDQPTANVSWGMLCSNSRPGQKLFSELIREAHVSLQRCSVEQLGIRNGATHRTEQTNTKAAALKSNRKDGASFKTQSETSPAVKNETILTKRKQKEDKHLWNSSSCQDDIKIDCFEVSHVDASALTHSSPVDPDPKCRPEGTLEVNLKQHKRPVPLPLPALALFLKQHSAKSKKLKSKQVSPTSALPSGSLSGSQSSTVSSYLPTDHISSAADFLTSLAVDVAESNNQATGCTDADVNLNEIALNDTGQLVETALQPSSLSCPNALATTSLNELGTERTLVLPISDKPLGSLHMSTSTISSSLTTSSASPTFPPPLDTVLFALKSPQTGAITESSSDVKSESLLLGPECSSIGFEPLSPANSPEPLSALPDSLGLGLDNGASGSTTKAPENLQHSKSSVFKWHTVLPYPDTSFTTFQPTPLTSITLPLLNSQSPSHPEPQALHTSTSATDHAPTFQDNEQSLPFPAELSPLALHLPLSPTFSSLDGGGLSPTPSLTDLVHFFSTDDDLGMGVEFSNNEAVPNFCSPPMTIEATAQELCPQVQTVSANKTFKRKKKSQRQNLVKTNMDQKTDDSSYTKMQPNLEEVEEQLFISFTSKEALKLHIAESEDPVTQMAPEAHLQSTTYTPGNESLGEKISAFEKILLRDLKLLKHRQVIHPVLQEVGLKMSLLDPTLAIDLQYLGVRLPIPPPGGSLKLLNQELPHPQAFVSRTGKTTDVTQIKGWREKFTPSESPSAPSSAKPEAGPSSDQTKKNLSAFCSDMLDEYLEHEGKLIDERAASFSQPQEESVVYELPTKSMSYVRTLDSVLKKQPCSSPTSDLISGFIPPSKRHKLCLKKISRKGELKPKGPKQNKLNRQKPEPGSTPGQTPSETQLPTKQPVVVTSPVAPTSDHTAAIDELQKSKKKHLKVPLNHKEPSTLPSQKAAFSKRRKLKPTALSRTISLPVSVTEDMAPLESDSELGATDRGSEACKKHRGPVMTRALLRQKDLEDGVVWEGQPRTTITEERAAVALTSLFTLMGFVSENPTAPIQLVRRQVPTCLNEFCRLGCICSSLSRCSGVSHCGRPQCMFGCNCLKQKVVLLKNLDSSDSSPSQHQSNKKRRRKRRMKMAYVLKEADSVSQPAERIQTLWKKDSGGSDPDPVFVPKPSSLPHVIESREYDGSCARIRAFAGRKMTHKPKAVTKVGKSKVVRLKSLMHRDPRPKETKTKALIYPQAHKAVCSTLSKRTPSPSLEPFPKPSKRLIILAECKWESDVDRNHVLKTLCEAMSQDQLGDPFWIKKYLISPLSQTVEENGTDCCIQYKIHISTPKMVREKPPKTQQQLVQKATAKPHEQQDEYTNQQEHLRQVVTETRPLEDWQQEVIEEEELLEDWQREVEEDDVRGDAGSKHRHGDNGKKKKEEKMSTTKKMNSMGLPFLTGISPAGFLSADKKKPSGTDHLVQVNGKLYPLAKIQLGKMGALHPANRLAAYLTGRVGSTKDKRMSSSVPPQFSGLIPQITSSTSSVGSTPTTSSLRPRTSVLTRPTSSTGLQVDQSAASKAPERAVTPNQVKSVTTADGSALTTTESPVKMSVVRPVNLSQGSTSSKSSQILMVDVLSSLGKVPASSPVTHSSTSTSKRIILKPVHMASGVQYYRRPDGKLVQLVPVSRLRSEDVQRGRSVLPVVPIQTPAITTAKQTLPLTTVMTTLTTSSSTTPSVSDLQSSSVPLSSSPFQAASGSLPQKGTCTFKILPAGSNKEPIIITCPKVPLQAPTKVLPVPGSFILLQPHANPPITPGKLVSLKSSPDRDGRVKATTVSAPLVGLGGVLTHQDPAASQKTESPTVTSITSEVEPPPPPASGRSSPDPEVASDPVDLDIICVDDDTMEVVNVGRSSSGDTENSTESESETDGDKEKIKSDPRLLHNVLERKRRGQMRQLFECLKKEVGLSHEKTSKVSTLKKAVQVIEELKMADRHLEMRKKKLRKRRDEYLSTLAPTTDKSRQEICRSQRLHTSVDKRSRHKHRVDVDLMEVVDLLEESDELTDNSSDEEMVVTKTTDMVTVTNDEEGEVQCVTVQTENQTSRLNAAKRRLARMTKNSDGSSVKKNIDATSDTRSDACRAWSSVLNTNASAKTLVMEKDCEEIQMLQSLNQQRDTYITESSRRSGKERGVPGAANLVPASGDGASKAPPSGNGTDDNVVIMSPDQVHTSQASPAPASIMSPIQQPQMILQFSNTLLPAPTPAPAPTLRDKPRTVPNILSRSKNPAASLSLVTNTVQGETPSFQTLVPTEVLSLVGTALPGQPILTLSPMMGRPTVLQTTSAPGMASVTLNIPSLANQHIRLASLPCPPAATNVTNLLQLVQPQQLQLQHQLQRLQLHKHHQQQVPPGQPPSPPLLPSSLVGSTGSDQIKDQDQAKCQTKLRWETSLSPHCIQGPSSSLCPGLSKEGQAGVVQGGAVRTEEGTETESLTSLLNEISFLNQETITTATPARVSSPSKWFPEMDEEELDRPRSPWVLQLDSDSDDAVTMVTEEAGTTEDQSTMTNRNSKTGVLAPPPLLQMNVGGAKLAEPTTTKGPAGGGSVGGGSTGGGAAWRPMPRLVPLGLRGNHTS